MTENYLRVNEIKNYLYCQRIAYYTLCLGLDRETGLSQAGITAENETKKRMRRRKYALHAVHEGQRSFDVPIFSHEYRLVGRLDELISTPQGLYLVDYKDSTQDYGYWKLQICAYVLSIQEQYSEPLLGSYIYTIPTQTYHSIQPTARDRKKLLELVQAIEQMVKHEVCPSPPSQLGKCRVCQYARFCNDVF